MSKRENVLLIYTDQHKYDALSLYGKVKGLSPNIDKLAEEGLLFKNAYTPSPVCGPARASLFTGEFCGDNGVVFNWRPFREGVVTLPEKLAASGYETFLCGKLHFIPHSYHFGFKERHLNDAPYSVYSEDAKYSKYIDWLKEDYYTDTNVVKLFDDDELAIENGDMHRFIMGSNFRTFEQHDIPWTAERAVEFIDHYDSEQPFFMNVSFFGPHQPYEAPEPYSSYEGEIAMADNHTVDMKGNPVFDKVCSDFANRLKDITDEEHEQFIRAYYGQIQMIDRYIGDIIEALENKNLYEDTTIIFTADHGDYLGSYGLYFKGQMYDACAKVPFIIKPSGITEGRSVDDTINSMDLYATVMELAGLKNDSNSSKSLVPYMSDEDYEGSDETMSVIFISGCTHTMIRKGDLKLMKTLDGEEELYEMYDLNDDPNETLNLWSSTALEDFDRGRRIQVNQMKNKLDGFTYHQYEQCLVSMS